MNSLENNISDISRNHYHYLMSLENVNGIGLSYKYINGKNTFEPCLCVLVENKVSSKILTASNIIPKSYMGIKTDVIAIGKTSLSSSGSVLFFKMRPLKGGAQIGPINRIVYGTMCCVVKKTIKKGLLKKTQYYILSNNHVLSNHNQYPIGSYFMQPSLEDNGNFHTDMVASLSNFVPIKFLEDDSEYENLVDAAIAEIYNNNIVSNEIYSQGKLKGAADPVLLLNVKKVGATTGLTSGHVIAINSSVTITTSDNRQILYKKQIISDLGTNPGDSGSPILTIDNKIVGMHMGGAGDGFSIANNINIVLEKLDVQLHTG